MGSPPFARAGTLRADYDRVDWAATGAGPVDGWAPALPAALRLILTTRFPATLFWGPDLVLMYNEAYVPLIGDKHPAALGAPAREVFPEAWDTIGPMLDGVLAGRGPTWVEDQRLLLDRHGFLEECYFTFSYSPVDEPGGGVLGVLDIAAETTRQVLDRRRLELLARLSGRLRSLPDPALLAERALPVLRGAERDLATAAIGPPPARPDPAAVTVALSAELALTVRLSAHLAPDQAYRDFVGLVAGTLRQALAAAEVTLADRTMSETLQRSLLTDPVQPPGCEIAVRYQPAALGARIGGDWYDAFPVRDGATCLVIGDVAGHDQQAAALMGQLRNLLRGVSYSGPGSPAAVLTAVDEAMRGLSVGTLATAVVARIGDGRLTWSNAGHLPPLVIDPDGTARLLAGRPELLLGVDPAAARTDSGTALPPGTTVLLYTDGLVERRGTSLDDSLDHLVAAAAALAGAPLDELCDRLLAVLSARAEDDIALLALRTR